MKRRTAISMAASGLTASFAGCPRTDYPAGATIDFDGRIVRPDASFEMKGEVEAAGLPEKDSYQDVSVNLYSKDVTRIYREDLGELRVGEPLKVDIAIDHVPYYVTCESPDFWDSKTEFHYYERTEDPEYRVHSISEKEELPVYS